MPEALGTSNLKGFNSTWGRKTNPTCASGDLRMCAKETWEWAQKRPENVRKRDQIMGVQETLQTKTNDENVQPSTPARAEFALVAGGVNAPEYGRKRALLWANDTCNS